MSAPLVTFHSLAASSFIAVARVSLCFAQAAGPLTESSLNDIDDSLASVDVRDDLSLS